MVFRTCLPIEIERPGDEFNTMVTANIQLVCQGGQWRAQCQDPPVLTVLCETLDQALIAAAKEVLRDLRAKVGACEGGDAGM